MRALTERQQQVLDLIKRYVDKTGFPPTRAEIAEELGFRSANAAEEHLRALAKKGVIEMVSGASRGLRLVDYQKPPQGLPLVGRVAAGNPILAEENIEDYLEIPASLFHPPADYLLKVRGMSMKDIGIMDGDLLAVKRSQSANDGEIIVARVDNEVTVKRLKREGPSTVLLIAENEDFDPIKVNLAEQEFAIEGISVGIIRR